MIPGVRRALVAAQRALGATSSCIMEGRDIGTVVFPDADVKIFLDADPSARAGRRVLDARRAGLDVPAESIAQEIAERDHRDRTRAEAPLVQAPDALYLDTTGLTLEVTRILVRVHRFVKKSCELPDALAAAVVDRRAGKCG